MKQFARGVALGLAIILLLGCSLSLPVYADSELPFLDISSDAWYYGAVKFCYSNGIMSGTSPSTFEPNGTVTREMVAQVIYKLAGGTSVEYTPIFQDVPEGRWYTNSILWDAAQGLAYGVSADPISGVRTFGVRQFTTREQVVTFLYRFQGRPETEAADTGRFSDFSSVSSWAEDSMLWAISEGILSGFKYGDTIRLNPRANCTRAELAQIIRRYLDASSRTTELLPETDVVPVSPRGSVTINGKKMPKIYETAASPADALIRLSDLSLAWPSSAVETFLTDDGTNYSCRVTISGRDYSFTRGVGNVFYDGFSWYLPARQLPMECGYSEYLDRTENHVYFTKLPDTAKIPSGVKVPVLMYHAVSDNCWGIQELFVSPTNMEEQLKYLKNNGFSPIWFEDLDQVSQYKKPVILTFDDGYRDNYTELFPLLKKYNVKATIFIFPQNIGKEKFLTWDMVQEMVDSGLVSIQSHTMSHTDLNSLSYEKQQWELAESKRVITARTGKECFVLCYPSGKYDNNTLALAKNDYLFGIKMNGNLYTTGTDRYLVPRYYVSRYTTLNGFAGMIS